MKTFKSPDLVIITEETIKFNTTCFEVLINVFLTSNVTCMVTLTILNHAWQKFLYLSKSRNICYSTVSHQLI